VNEQSKPQICFFIFVTHISWNTRIKAQTVVPCKRAFLPNSRAEKPYDFHNGCIHSGEGRQTLSHQVPTFPSINFVLGFRSVYSKPERRSTNAGSGGQTTLVPVEPALKIIPRNLSAPKMMQVFRLPVHRG
jgi:hypothetical protein